MSIDTIKQTIGALTEPLTGQTLAELDAVRHVVMDGGRVALELAFGFPVGGQGEAWEARIAEALASLGVNSVSALVTQRIASHAVQGELKPLPNIKNIIAVGSGKGGVGKSTTAINLALGLKHAGARVGILDADIYGPSIPLMLGLNDQGKPDVNEAQRLIPMKAFGLEAMSMGFMVEDETAMIWRGPMVSQALQELLTKTDWGNLDYLIIDLPPGTGDIQLTLSQKVPVAGAVIITTPQDIALLDARRACRMFDKVNVPVLGIVENMSVHVCSQCGHAEAIFGEHGAHEMADDFDAPVLGSLPLNISIRQAADAGLSLWDNEQNQAIVAVYQQAALRMAAALSLRPKSKQLGLGVSVG